MAIVREEDEETLVCVEGLVFLGKIGLKKEASLHGEFASWLDFN